jgi:hypothetical protein
MTIEYTMEALAQPLNALRAGGGSGTAAIFARF